MEKSLAAPSCFCSPVSVVSDLCGGVGGGDEQVDHARLQLLQTQKYNCVRRQLWPAEWLRITLNYMNIPDTSLWWCHRTRPLRRQRPLPPVWPSRPSRAAGGPRRSASQPDERSARRWVYTSDPCTQLQTDTGGKIQNCKLNTINMTNYMSQVCTKIRKS